MGEPIPTSHEAPDSDRDPTLEDVLLYARQIEAYMNNHLDEMTPKVINGINQSLNEMAENVYTHRDVVIDGCYRIYRRDNAGSDNFFLEEGLMTGVSHGFIIEPLSFFQDGEYIGALSDGEAEISRKIAAGAQGRLVVSHVALYNQNEALTEPLGAYEDRKSFIVAPINTANLSIFESSRDPRDGFLNESERLLHMIDEPTREAVMQVGYEVLCSEDALLSMREHIDTLEPVLQEATDRDWSIITRYLYACGLEFFNNPIPISSEQPLIIDDVEFGEDLVQLANLPEGTMMEFEGLYVYSRYVEGEHGQDVLDASDSSLYAHASLLKNAEGDKLHVLIPISHYRTAAKVETPAPTSVTEL